MNRIKTQSVPKTEQKNSIDDLIIRFCYYFQQYKYNEARLLPLSRIKKMLKVADKELCTHYMQLTQIAVAPHTTKGTGVKNLMDVYEKGMNG